MKSRWNKTPCIKLLRSIYTDPNTVFLLNEDELFLQNHFKDHAFYQEFSYPNNGHTVAPDYIQSQYLSKVSDYTAYDIQLLWYYIYKDYRTMTHKNLSALYGREYPKEYKYKKMFLHTKVEMALVQLMRDHGVKFTRDTDYHVWGLEIHTRDRLNNFFE